MNPIALLGWSVCHACEKRRDRGQRGARGAKLGAERLSGTAELIIPLGSPLEAASA